MGMTDAAVGSVAAGLPPNLENLNLSFGECPNITDAGVVQLAKKIPGTAKEVRLDFSGCNKVSDEGAKSIAESLPQIDGANVRVSLGAGVTDAGILAIVRSL